MSSPSQKKGIQDTGKVLSNTFEAIPFTHGLIQPGCMACYYWNDSDSWSLHFLPRKRQAQTQQQPLAETQSAPFHALSVWLSPA